jgi:predicted transcriptional regulator
MDSNSSNPSPAEVSKIAAMREILFGENINQYQKEFDAINKRIDEVSSSTDHKLAEIKQLLQNVQAQLEASLTLKTDKAHLAQLLLKMADELKKG